MWLPAQHRSVTEIAPKSLFLCQCEQEPYPLWFSIRRKTYPAKCENSLNLTLPTIMLPNTSSSSDDITTRPWVREIITGSSNDIKKKADPFIYLFQESSRFFFIPGLWASNVQDQKGNVSKQRDKKKKQQSVQYHSFGADLSWSVRLLQYSKGRIFDRLKICKLRRSIHTELP